VRDCPRAPPRLPPVPLSSLNPTIPHPVPPSPPFPPSSVPADEVPLGEAPVVPYVIDSFLPGPGHRVTVSLPVAGGSGGVLAAVAASKAAGTNPSATKTNFTSLDFLGLGSDDSVRQTAQRTMEEYSVGSCGPRGFYGSTLKHLSLEDSIAKFFNAPESITYSDATATIASVIPAFAKRGDILLVDQGCNFGIQNGARLSRSKMVFFRHQDLADLREKLEGVRAQDAQAGRSSIALTQRRFIIVEGLYASSGHVADLERIVALAAEFKWRIILDDSIGFGVLGPSGKGSVERANGELLPVEVVVGSLSTTLASVGGFCVGSREVVDHQRLSGAGYCFSASAPPFTCATAEAALSALEARPHLLQTLRARSASLHMKLSEALAGCFTVLSSEVSPLKFLKLTDQGKRALSLAPRSIQALAAGGVAGGAGASGAANNKGAGASAYANDVPAMKSPTTQEAPARLDRAAVLSRADEEASLDAIVRRCCVDGGVLVSRNHSLESEPFPAPPCLKVVITALHSEADVDAVVAAIDRAFKAEIGVGVPEVGAGVSTKKKGK
jgi:7-keto-8-aminopelargonate synthetase-like enzyme